jgi:mono/diheme cytochrome c family protein
LAPDLATVATRRPPTYVAAMIDDPQHTVPGTIMPRIAMPAATRALVVRYLANGVSVAAPSAVTAVAMGDTSGARLYARTCAGCHGTIGRGDGPNAPHLPVPPAVHASREAMAARTDDRLYDAIAAGGEPLGRSARMPAFGGTLSPAQIRALVRHIRALCACDGPRWSTDGARPR